MYIIVMESGASPGAHALQEWWAPGLAPLAITIMLCFVGFHLWPTRTCLKTLLFWIRGLTDVLNISV